MRVFVINQRGEPLMPCSEKRARFLLKEGKARIYKYNPFTIQLLYPSGESTQEVNIGVDTGAKYIGIAITSANKVLIKGIIELRQDVHDNIQLRKILRENRRNRKTRYRKARFLFRNRIEGWLPPSIQSRLNLTFMWIDKFVHLVPNHNLHIEVGKFNLPNVTNFSTLNPKISSKESYDIRYFVFARDEYVCQVCKKKNKYLRIHHIVYKSKGGSDKLDNLITVCTDCHTSKNHNEGEILYKWMIDKKKVKQYKEATFMNILRKRIISRYKSATILYGSETTPRRKTLMLSKTHYNDAIAISGIEYIQKNSDIYFYYKQFRKKKRSLHESKPRKWRKNKNINSLRSNKNVRFRNGYYLNDKVKYKGIDCWVYGFSGGEYGKECILRNIDSTIIKMSERINSLSVNMKNTVYQNHNNGWQYTTKSIIREAS